MRLQCLVYLVCPRRHSLPIKCVLNPALTERTSPPCSYLKTTGADPQIHRTSWALQRYWRVTRQAQTKTKKRENISLMSLGECAFILILLKTFSPKRCYFLVFIFKWLHLCFITVTPEPCSMQCTQVCMLAFLFIHMRWILQHQVYQL